MKSEKNIVRYKFSVQSFLGTALVAGGLIFGAGSMKGQEVKVFSQKHVTAINPHGIVTGGVDLNDPKYGKRITEEEIDEAYRLKGTTGSWYGDQVVNPFIRPGYRDKDMGEREYYGSKDVNGNHIINEYADIQAIYEGNTSYRGDVNGDGITNSTDAQIIQKVMEGQIPYAPSDWNYLNTENREGEDEKLDYFEKIVKLDDTNTYVEGFGCGDYASKFVFRTAGLEKPREYSTIAYFTDVLKLDLEKDNGLYNLPVYMVVTKAKNGQDHATVGILTGEDPTRFENFKVLEEQIDEFVEPGDFSMRNEIGDIVRFERLCYYYSLVDNVYKYAVRPMVTYEFDAEGKLFLKWKNPYLVTSRPGNPVTNVWETSISQQDISGKAYPNPYSPYSGQDGLKIPYYGNGLEANVRITDMLGRIIYNETYESNISDEIKIPNDSFRNVASGLYNVSVSNKKGRQSLRIVIGK